MTSRDVFRVTLAGAAAGVINGLFGAGGGMVLVPILGRCTHLEEEQVFPCSVSIILPICIVTLCTNIWHYGLPVQDTWQYLVGGVIGGLLSGRFGHHIPTKYLHRTLGLLILWGGILYLC